MAICRWRRAAMLLQLSRGPLLGQYLYSHFHLPSEVVVRCDVRLDSWQMMHLARRRSTKETLSIGRVARHEIPDLGSAVEAEREVLQMVENLQSQVVGDPGRAACRSLSPPC